MEIPGYRLFEMIGEGGMSEVYRAEQLSLKRIVAIKFLSEKLLSYSTALDLFENESMIIARLNHPKIIHVIDKGMTSDGKPFFVMEFVEGITLHDLVQEQKVSISKKVDYIIQVCRGFYYAHRNSIVHRDIKPANIIIDKENNARILDFGIASFYTDERYVQKGTSKIMGTDRYMAPEVYSSSENASILSDIYSLGITMYEVFAEDFENEVTNEQVQQSTKLPVPIKELILSCMNIDPTKRPDSTKVIENQLLHLIKGAHLALTQKAKAEKDLASLGKQFTLLDVIVENDYSSVYLYEKNNNNSLIIIKKRMNDASGLKEAKLLSTLKHPYIINIHGTSNNDRTYIVVMEYMNGGSLADQLLDPFSYDMFFDIALKLTDALLFAHQNRIIHGNIRPSNILFDHRGVVKVTDFGLSEHYQFTEENKNWYHPQESEPTSVALDVFALGAIFYHMLCGEPLSWKNGQINTSENYAKLPEQIQTVLIKMLALDPDYRHQSMAEVMMELESLKRSPKKRLVRKRRKTITPVKPPKTNVLSVIGKTLLGIFFLIVLLYLNIYFFFPDAKLLIHLELREFFLWLADELVSPRHRRY